MEAGLTRSGEEGVLVTWALTHGCRLTALLLAVAGSQLSCWSVPLGSLGSCVLRRFRLPRPVEGKAGSTHRDKPCAPRGGFQLGFKDLLG